MPLRRFACFRRLAGLVALSVASTACHDWVPVRPAELGKMQPSREGPPPRLVQTNGALVEIDDDSDVRLTLQDGAEHWFTHPVSARIESNVLVIRGGNRGERRFPVESLEKVEVAKFNGGTTATVIVLGSVAGVVGTYLLLHAIRANADKNP